jgi:hypothetical protein
MNLVENIGFLDECSSHTKENWFDKKILYHKRKNIKFPLKHPKKISENKSFVKKYL